MERRKRINMERRITQDSSQNVQASDNEGIQLTPTHATPCCAQGSHVGETQSILNDAEHTIHESIESHFIPPELDGEEEQVVKEPKQHRGPTRMLDIWEMEEGQFVVVDLDEDGRPIGEEATTLTRFIGSLVRRHQYAPINYKSWKEMSKEHKEEMLKILEAKFEFVPPINDETRQMLKNQLNEKWRQWKFDLKSMAFDPSKTEEQVASILPDDRVDSSQYRDLVHYWFSENGQKISEINRQNRAKYEDVHCMGTKSLPKLIAEKKHKAKGLLPNRKEIYIDTRTRKDGTIVNEKAARVIEELNKYNNDESGPSNSGTQSDVSWKEDIFSKVKGPDKKGHVRCMGKMSKSKKVKASFSENEDLRNKVKHMENMMTNMISFIQSRFSGADVDEMIKATKQVQDSSTTPTSFGSPNSIAMKKMKMVNVSK